MIGRSITALTALVAMPAYLLSDRMPGSLETVAALAWLSPFIALLALSRSGGRLAVAQAVVTLALGACVTAAAALATLSVFAAGAAGLLIVADAAAFPSRRTLALAALVALPAPILAIVSGSGSTGPGSVDLGGLAVSVAVPFALGHALSFVLVEGRLAARLRDKGAQDAFGETATLRAVDDLVTWHDPQGSVLRATPASSRLLGVEPRNLAGSGLFTLIHVSDRPAYLMALSDAAHRGRSVALQLRVKVRGGQDRADTAAPDAAAPAFLWMEMHAQPLREPADRRCAVVCVLRDITRTRQDIEALREARREAVRSHNDRARLLADASHELRAPLAELLGHAELLAGRTMPLSAELRLEYARAILQSGRHLLEVVDTLIDLSAIEAGRVRLAFEPFDPVALASECCALITPAAEEAGITLRVDVTNNPPFLRADRRACRQILLNLLSNAIKVTPRGVTLSVTVRRGDDAIVFALRDMGIGGGRAEPTRRGTPCDRVVSRGGSIEGSGLGLSVVHGLVGLHRGQLHIDEGVGAGISVEVVLPIEPEASASPGVLSDGVRPIIPGRARNAIPFQREVPCPPISIAG